jgi:hypothetical protein
MICLPMISKEQVQLDRLIVIWIVLNGQLTIFRVVELFVYYTMVIIWPILPSLLN